jgi:cysteine desulfurase
MNRRPRQGAYVNTKGSAEFKDNVGTNATKLKRVYLDANAGAPLLDAAREAAVAALGAAANASSVHAEGRQARVLIEAARDKVAAAVGARPEAVIFTSGATEAAALALSPRVLSGRESLAVGQLYVGATEHPCVLSGGRFPAETVSTLPVSPDGTIDLAALEAAMAAHDRAGGVPLVALMLANNETGVVHPVAEAAQAVKRHGGLIFCDAVQALGRIAVDIGALGVDFLSLSAHKIGGPQGAGALVLADADVRPEPLLKGGGQERRRRAGTENVTSIVGFGVAAEHAGHHLSDSGRIAGLRDRLEREIREISPEARIMGDTAERLPNTTLFAAPGLSAETVVIAFDLEGIAVSAGSACSSGKIAASHVAEAMGEPPEVARSGIRVSLTPASKEDDIAAFVAAWRGIHTRMRQSRAA